MTKGSFSCKQSMIYGHQVNSCKQKPAPSSQQQLGPFLAVARLHFLSIHAKVFRTAISSVLIWVCSPTGLAEPFIILGAWSCVAPSQVVFVNSHWPGSFHFAKWKGDTVVLRCCHQFLCQTLCFNSTGVKAKGKCHVTWLICHMATAELEWMEWWQHGPLAIFKGSTALDSERRLES